MEVPRALAHQRWQAGSACPVRYRTPAASRRVSRGGSPTFRIARRLLLIASAEPAGDATLVWSAAARLGIGPEAATAAVEAGLAEFGAYVHFQHPLARSVAYRSRASVERQAAHRALAEVIDRTTTPTGGPGTSPTLRRTRRRRRRRTRALGGPRAGPGGLAAAAAFLERATVLTVDPAKRAVRALDAAGAKVEAGALDAAVDLLAIAEAGPLDEFQQARLDLVRAQLAFVTSRGSDAPPLLLQAARRLGPIDAELSRATYLDAMSAAMFAGRLATGGGVTEVRRRGNCVRGLATPLASDLLLDGLATQFNEGYAAALPILRKALTAFGNDLPAPEALHWFWLACIAATHVWDDARWQELSAGHVEAARNVGALSELPLALSSRALMLLFAGELAEAGSLIEEIQTVTDATGSNLLSYAVLALAAFRGNRAEVATLTETTLGDVTRRGEGLGITVAEWSNAVFNNGLGRYEEAMDAAMRAAEFPADLRPRRGRWWSSSRRPRTAACAGRRSTPTDGWSRRPMRVAPTGRWARVPAAPRSSPMATPPTPCTGNRSSGSAEPAFASSWRGRTCCTASGCATSNDEVRHARICTRPSACSMPMGMDAFAERARLELQTTGDAAAQPRSPAPGTGGALTAQEAQIARMARDGLSNPEIGSRLLHQRPHGSVPPAQGVREARHHLAQPARTRASRRVAGARTGLAAVQWRIRTRAAETR